MLYDYYFTIKAIHILSFIAWMAGLLYLPRLFIYHLGFEKHSTPYGVFCTMERRLLKIIMLPSIIMTFGTGLLMAELSNLWTVPWFQFKLVLVVLLAALHGFFSTLSKAFIRRDFPAISRKTLLILNEIPFLLAIGIVFLAVLKPAFGFSLF